MTDEYIYLDIAYATGVFDRNMVKVVEDGGFDFTKDELNEAVTGDDAVDKTALAESYLALADDDPTSEMYGLVKVNKELAELLQQLMDKYTYAGVEESWLKLCYYIAHLQ